MTVHDSRWRMRAGALVLAGTVWFAFAPNASAQVQLTPQDSAAPVLTGYGGVSGSGDRDGRSLSPTFAPILLVPVGERLLFEGEFELEGAYQSRSGAAWSNEWERAVEYAQLDWFVGKGLTLVGGRFLTPFGIYNERLHSGWIRNLPDQPIVAAMELTSSTGGMGRGSLSLGRKADFNYIAFASAPSERSGFEAAKAGGGRGSVFFPSRRLEIGASFQRQFEGDGSRDDQYGTDLTWQANAIPLDVRGEYVRNAERGSGYWAEGAYRLRRVPFARVLMRNSQLVFRAEQFFVPSAAAMDELTGAALDEADEEEGHGGALPDEDTTRLTAGWNYWITPSVRASVSFARTLSTDATANVWSFGFTYRFATGITGRSR